MGYTSKNDNILVIVEYYFINDRRNSRTHSLFYSLKFERIAKETITGCPNTYGRGCISKFK